MPGQRITDRQVKRYKELQNRLPQEAAAAKVDTPRSAGVRCGTRHRLLP